ncbi:hypothetical protein [Niabella aquatica]
MRSKKYIVSTLLFFIVALIKAQNATPVHDRDPQFPKIETPNAASFSKFIDNPISLYNGTPDISIALFNLKDGAIEIPITLRYNTSGIKVNEEASWVGLGWNLNVGGIITKHSVGKADEVDGGYDYLDFLGYMNLCGRNIVETYCSPVYTEAMHNNWFEELTITSYNRMGQLNPDVYYYSYPGGSGKFIMDHRDKKIYLLNRENAIQILAGVNFYTDGFTILTDSGVEHFFNRRSSISDPSQQFATTSINYALEYTIYPNGQRVDYTYATIPYSSTSLGGESFQRITDNSNNIPPNGIVPISGISNHTDPDYTTLEGTEIVLTGIQTTNYKVIFTTSGRTDLKDGLKLDKITIEPRVKNADSEIKQLEFKYGYFVGKAIGKSYLSDSQYALNRLKLNAINYLDKTNTVSDNRYDFYYEEETLPKKGSYAMDYWGYYNGQPNVSLLPNIEYLYFGLLSQSRYKDVFGWCKDLKVYGLGGVPANRASEERYTKAGILKGVKYPTGGYREFEYELNSFVDYYIPTVSEIKNEIYYTDNISDRNNSNDKKSCNFTLTEDSKISLAMTVARGLNTWYEVMNHSLKIYKINGTGRVLVATADCGPECYTNHINSVPGGIVNKEVSISLSTGQYIAEVDLPDALGDQTLSNSKHGDFRVVISFAKPVNTNESKGCGLRIKNITAYNDIDKGEKLLSTNYTYTKEGTGISSGVLHEKPQYHQIENCNYTIEYKDEKIILEEISTVHLIVLLEQFVLGANNYISNPYGTASPVGYSAVKETQNGTNAIGYTIHHFINEEPMVSQHSVRLDNPLNGRLNDLKVYNSSNQLKKEEKYYYRSAVYHNYHGINIVYAYNMYPGLFSQNGFYTMIKTPLPQPSYGSTLFYIRAHPLNSVDIYLDKKETTIDGITTTDIYKFNDTTHQLKEHATTLSNGSTLKRTFSYVNDYNYMDYGMEYYKMTSKNMLSNIVEEKIFRDGGYIGGSLTTYSFSNLLRKALYFSEANGRLGNVVTYDKNGINTNIYSHENVTYKEYDTYNNPIYIVHNGVSDLVYLWSYQGQYPIAEIKNATYNQVQAAVQAVFSVANINELSQLDNPSADKIELLRTNNNLANALVTTFTYTPLVGIRTATDAKGMTTFYDYDSFGRLKEVYIKENGVKRIIESYEYHLSNN